MIGRPPLFKNQQQSVDFEKDHPRVCDWSDPGTGKTRARLEAFAQRRARGGGRALVLAPKSLLYSAWAVDARRYTPWLGVSCAYAENRAEAFEKKADIYVTNHDAAKWLAKQPASFFSKFTDLIIDESDAFKHHTSDRSKAIAKIKQNFERRIVQTGTPDSNSITDMWHQVNIVDDGERLGKSFYAFRANACVAEQVGPSSKMVKWHDRENIEEVVAELIKDITIRHLLKECQDIPANHKYIVPFQLRARHRAKYMEMEDLAAVELKSKVINAVNAAAVATKLLQIASGAVYDEEGNYHVVNEDRYELVADLADEVKHSVVFFLWRHQRDLLLKQFEDRGITCALIDGSTSRKARDQAVERYQAGMYRVILAHPASAAHGLTLTRGTRTIWASPTYNLSHWIQGNHRIDRAGQKHKTETINVLAEGTLEEHVYRVLTTKKGKLESMLSYLAKRA